MGFFNDIAMIGVDKNNFYISLESGGCMAAKSLTWKDDDGSQYKISYSEELQLKNLDALKRQTLWMKRGLLVMTLLLGVFTVFTLVMLYTLYRLDVINFFTRIAFR